MKEKEKGKGHPFVGILHDNEEILWMTVSSTRQFLSWRVIRGLIIIAMLSLFLTSGILSSIGDSARFRDPNRLLEVGCASVLGALLVIAMVVTGVYRVLTYDYNPEYAYGLSNKRVLYRSETYQCTLSLECVPTLSLFGNHTLSFGAVFPMWSGLDDAEHVRNLIEQAQKERRKALSTGD